MPLRHFPVKRKLFLAFLLLAAILINLGLAAVFAVIENVWARSDEIFAIEWRFSYLATLGAIPVVLTCLFFETRILGWKDSSARKILEGGTASRRTDLFYLFSYCSNLQVFFGLLFSFGLAFVLSWGIRDTLSFGLLSDLPIFAAFGLQWIIGPLFFYITHWLMHRPGLWEFHKVHHSAEEMSMINNFREHPFAHAVRIVIETFPTALLGMNPIALLLYAASSGVLVVWQHTDVDWKMPWLEKYLFIGAKGHRLHHSRDPRHFNRNFGFVAFWDHVFGTFASAASSDPIQIGIDDSRHNKINSLAEMFSIPFWALGSLRKSILSLRIGRRDRQGMGHVR